MLIKYEMNPPRQKAEEIAQGIFDRVNMIENYSRSANTIVNVTNATSYGNGKKKQL